MFKNDWTKHISGAANVQVYLMFITPRLAKEWLDGAANFRDLSRDRLCEDIAAGRFTLTAATLHIMDGKCEDGQHRLAAVAKTGCGILSFVIFSNGDSGIDLVNQDTNVMKRKLADHLKHQGYVNCSRLSAMVVRLIGLEAKGGDILSYIRSTKASPSAQVGLAAASRMPVIIDLTNLVDRLKVLGATSETLGVPLIAATQAGYPLSALSIFCERLKKGPELRENDPCRHLYFRLAKNTIAKTKLSSSDQMAMFIKTLNLFFAGSTGGKGKVAYRSSGTAPEAFPTIDASYVSDWSVPAPDLQTIS
jgi:hypothetical protein